VKPPKIDSITNPFREQFQGWEAGNLEIRSNSGAEWALWRDLGNL